MCKELGEYYGEEVFHNTYEHDDINETFMCDAFYRVIIKKDMDDKPYKVKRDIVAGGSDGITFNAWLPPRLTKRIAQFYENGVKRMIFDDYYKKYLPLIKKLSYKNKVNGYTPEDIEQELLMVLDKCIKNFDETKKVKFITYFQSSCRYHIISLRKQNINYEMLLRNPEMIIDDSGDIMTKLLNDKFKKKLMDLLEEVKYGDYIKLYYLFNISMTKIAKIEKVDKSHISRCIKEGIGELKEKLEKII